MNANDNGMLPLWYGLRNENVGGDSMSFDDAVRLGQDIEAFVLGISGHGPRIMVLVIYVVEEEVVSCERLSLSSVSLGVSQYAVYR